MENGHVEYKKKYGETFEKYAGKSAMVYLLEDGRRLTLTYAQFHQAILQIKGLLDSAALSDFDRIAVLSPLTPFAAVVNVALPYLGYTAVPLDISLPAEEIDRLLRETEVSAIFVAEQLQAEFDQRLINAIPVFEMQNDFTCRLRSVPEAIPAKKMHGDSDVAVIIYSSGTTGSMKGVEITYTALIYAFRYLVEYTNLTSSATYMNVLPINHIVGYSVVTSCFLVGCEVGFLADASPLGLSHGFLTYNPTNFIMIPKVYEVIREKMEAAIRKKPFVIRWYAYGAMWLCGTIRKLTGAKLRFLTKPIWSAALGQNMRICGCGAAPCMPETAVFFLNLGIDFVDVYGSTETCFPITAANCNDKYPLAGTGSITQFPEIHIKIFQPDSEGIGEVYVKTPMIMKGYFKDPELTAAVFDENGYFKTGDLGYVDRKGNLYVTGRIKETILLKTGKKVSPSDVDAYYSKLCGGVKIASCGVSGPKGFDTVHLFIETRGHSKAEISEACGRILKHSSASGSAYQISAVHEIEHLPLTPIGKVRRYVLKELAEAEKAAPAAVPADHTQSVFDAISGLIASIMGTAREISPDSRLQEDIGMDSLEVFELCAALEDKFSASVESYLHDGITIGELEELVKLGGLGEAQEESAQYPLEKRDKDIRTHKKFMAISRLLWKVEVSGQENLYSGEKYIFCPNHESHLDGMWIIGVLDDEIKRDICSMAAEYLFDGKIFRPGLVMLGGIPVHRSGNTAPAMKRARECRVQAGRGHAVNRDRGEDHPRMHQRSL